MEIGNGNREVLKGQAKQSAFWGLAEKLGLQLLSSIVGLVMTRLLLPSDYGLIAALDLFIVGGLLLSDFGLGQEYIQNHNSTQEEQSLIVAGNFAISVIIYTLLFFGADVIARFFSQPSLSLITRVFALNIPIQAFGLFQQSRLMKELRLALLTKIKLFSLVIAGCIGVSGAVLGWGVWALVGYITVFYLLNTMQLWLFSDWRPAWKIQWNSARAIFPGASKILSANMIDALYTNFLTMYVTKIFRITTGGFYSKARLLQNMPVQSTLQLIQMVAYPVLSKTRNDDATLVEFFRRQIKILSFVLSLIMGLIILTAFPFVQVVLTDKWLPMVPYLRLLCVFGWMIPFHSLHSSLLIAKGKSGLNLRLELTKKILSAGLFICALSFGVEAIIVSQIVAAFFGLLLHSALTARLFGYRMREQFTDIIRPPFTAAALILLLGTLSAIVHNSVMLFLLQSLAAVLLYGTLSELLKFSERKFLFEIVAGGLSAGKNKTRTATEL